MLSMSLAVSSPMAGGKGARVMQKNSTMNLLLITVDGLRADHAGPGARVRNPAMTWLAREGARFTNAISPSPAEAPPVAALMTGRHPLALGMLADGAVLPRKLAGTNTSVPTLASTLRREGYATGAFVSSAALAGRPSGLDRGFSVYDDRIDESVVGSGLLGLPTLLRWTETFGGGTLPATDVLRPAALTLERFDTWLSYHYAGNFFGWLHLATQGFLSRGRSEGSISWIPSRRGRARERDSWFSRHDVGLALPRSRERRPLENTVIASSGVEELSWARSSVDEG